MRRSGYDILEPEPRGCYLMERESCKQTRVNSYRTRNRQLKLEGWAVLSALPSERSFLLDLLYLVFLFLRLCEWIGIRHMELLGIIS